MKKERYYLLDALRGATLVSMILYHAAFDLVEMYGVEISWFWDTPGYLWQQSICWTFILLSGFSWRLGHHPLKRGGLIFLCGLVITAVTVVFMPSERIFFGILTFTGTAMLVMAGLHPFLQKCPQAAGLLFSAAAFFLTRNINSGAWGFEFLSFGKVPESFYHGIFMTALGFPYKGFFSGDYFSFFPWFFLYLCGYFLYGILMSQKEVRQLLMRRVPVLEWIGKHTLPIYMAHQPVILAVAEMTMAISALRRLS